MTTEDAFQDDDCDGQVDVGARTGEVNLGSMRRDECALVGLQSYANGRNFNAYDQYSTTMQYPLPKLESWKFRIL